MPNNRSGIITRTLTGSFTTPDGASEIFLNNRGAATATFTGSDVVPDSGAASTAIQLAAGEKFAFGYIGKGRKSITIDATGTTVDISITL